MSEQSKKEQNPLISIIVPIYGVEPYLEECIQSLIAQTYQNIEIILVNDGSKDTCPMIVDAWAQKDTRIRALHKANGGQSSARNLGLDIATGEYVTFVDGDDWIEQEYVEMLYRGIVLHGTQVSVVGFYRELKGGREPSPHHTDTEDTHAESVSCSCRTEHALDYFFRVSIAVWGKLYHRNLFTDIRFPVGRLTEEYVVQLAILQKVERISFYNRHFYHYRIRGDSDSHDIKPQYIMDNIIAIHGALDVCIVHFPQQILWCEKRLSMLLYQFQVAEAYGRDIKQKNRNIIEKYTNRIGGINCIKVQMEESLNSIFYSRTQFASWLSHKEKRQLQQDFREVFLNNKSLHRGLCSTIKYILCFLNLNFAATIILFQRKFKS